MFVLRDVQCTGLFVAEWLTGEGTYWAMHQDDDAQIVITLAGTLSDRSESESFHYERTRNSAIIRPPKTIHEVRGCGEAHALVIDISADRFDAMLASDGGLFREAQYFDPADIAFFAAQALRDLSTGGADAPFLLEATVLSLIVRMRRLLRRREEERRPRWLDDLIAQVAIDPRQRLTARAVAAAAGIDHDSLSSAFLEYEGRSLNRYLAELRLERAATRLRLTNEGIATIAQEAGFYDHAHLIRTFRKEMGTTPSAYRKIHRGGPRATLPVAHGKGRS